MVTPVRRRRVGSTRRTIAALASAILAVGLSSVTGTATSGGGAVITNETRLDYDHLGPIEIGMTLAEARRASDQRLSYRTSSSSPRCGTADLSPKSLGVSLGVVDGTVIDIQLRRSPVRIRSGGRIGDTLTMLRARHGDRLRRDHPNPYVRTLTRGAYRIVLSLDARRRVDLITAGPIAVVEHDSLCA